MPSKAWWGPLIMTHHGRTGCSIKNNPESKEKILLYEKAYHFVFYHFRHS